MRCRCVRVCLLVLFFLHACCVAGTEAQRRLGARSRFGIDYVFGMSRMYRSDKWASKLAETGAGWVDFASVSWRQIEPRPPRAGRHRYRWEQLDASVRLWQQYGFEITMWLRLGNGWFAGPVKYQPLGKLLKFKGSDRLPAPEYMDDYRAWVRALVERYDGDGRDDMPGLLRPVLYYQCGNEYGNPMFWTGTLQDYVTLLKETRAAARAACTEVKIISNGLRWNNFFCGDPKAEKVQERWEAFLAQLPNDQLRRMWQRNYEFNLLTIKHADLVDVIDVGGNGPWPEASAGYFVWVKRELAKAGFSDKELWDAEARCEPPLIYRKQLQFHPDRFVPDGRTVLKMLKQKQHPRHDEVVRWYRAEQARICAKVFVTRFAAGAQKVFMGMPGDWDVPPAAWVVPNPYIGLMSSSCEPWPAYYAMKLLVEKLDGFDTVEQVAAAPDVELYRFGFSGGRTVWVAWLSEKKVRGLSDPLPARRVSLAPVRGPALVLRIPTSGQPAEPERIDESGPVRLRLSPTPVVIEPVR